MTAETSCTAWNRAENISVHLSNILNGAIHEARQRAVRVKRVQREITRVKIKGGK